MFKGLRILRDPETPPAGGTPPAAPSIPRTKEEWDRLAETDPKQWIAYTQPRMDQAVREAREANEKLKHSDNKYKNLESEFTTLKQKQPPPPVVDDQMPQTFSPDNLPQSKEDWDQLFIEDPTLATDLRHFKLDQDRQNRTTQNLSQQEFEKEHKIHRSELQSRHADMYVAETNADGSVKMDAEGKPVLKIDSKTGEPIPDFTTEKGKLFIEVFNEDQTGFSASKKGPRLIMLEMERRLREKAESTVNSGGGQSAPAKLDQRGTLPGGVTPPVTTKVAFVSDEEKAHAQKAVERGVYKNLEDYCKFRDGKNVGIVEVSRTPKFG